MVKETFKFSIRRLIQTKINGGIILLFVAVAAMLIANSPLQEHYASLLSKNISLTIDTQAPIICFMPRRIGGSRGGRIGYITVLRLRLDQPDMAHTSNRKVSPVCMQCSRHVRQSHTVAHHKDNVLHFSTGAVGPVRRSVNRLSLGRGIAIELRKSRRKREYRHKEK